MDPWYLPLNFPDLLYYPSVRNIEKVTVKSRKFYNWSLPIKTEALKVSCACSFGVTTRGPSNNHSEIHVSFVQTRHSSRMRETLDSSRGPLLSFPTFHELILPICIPCGKKKSAKISTFLLLVWLKTFAHELNRALIVMGNYNRCHSKSVCYTLQTVCHYLLFIPLTRPCLLWNRYQRQS